MNIFDSQGDDSLRQSIDSLILPPPPLSIFGDVPMVKCSDNSPHSSKDNMKINEPVKSFDNTYSIKALNYFLTEEDVNKYNEFKWDEVDTKNIADALHDFGNNDCKTNQILRLFVSFHKLYEEYIMVANSFNNISSNVNDNMEDEKTIKEIASQTFFKSADTLSVLSEDNISLDKYKIPFFDKIRNIIFPSTVGCQKCVSTQSKLIPKYSLFDIVNNEPLEVFETKKKTQHQIIHKIISKNKSKSHITIPIALELLIPKIKQKIEKVLNKCTFLCDPLEVVAELRNCNYDYRKCIKYFNTTQHLRYLYVRTHNLNFQTISKNSQSNSDMTNYKTINYTNVVVSDQDNLKRQIKNKIIEKYIDISIQTDTINYQYLCVSISKSIKSSKQIQRYLFDDIRYLRLQLNKVFDSLKIHMITVINQCSEKLIDNEQKLKLITLSRQNDELKLKLKEEEKKRRQFYNKMLEQMGNIRVYCRCRKLIDEENVLEYVGDDTIILTTAANERFEFDKFFHPGIAQAELYEEFKPLVMSFIDGYNVCFITYGGEASGKTYTLIGENRDCHQGIMQRSLTTILREERLRQRDWDYKISACLIEIYNDNCIDVLSGETGIQLYVDNGMETAYQKLKSVPITNEADAEALIQVCTVKRKVARTALNPASSRSHLIILIRLQGISKIHGENTCSFLCLCDLAGFEDIIKAETQMNKILSKEAGYINRSLTAFNRVFVSLKKQDPNTVCYRDTKLTHLLKPFLTNSGKCALIVTVRNDRKSVGSTHNTLRFGRETRGVTLGKARRQVNINSNHISHHPSIN